MSVREVLFGVMIVTACQPEEGGDTEGNPTTGATENATDPTSPTSSSSGEGFACSDGINHFERGELCDGDEFHCDMEDGCRPRAFVSLEAVKKRFGTYTQVDTVEKMDQICTGHPPIYESPEIAYRAYVDGEARPFDAGQFPGAKLWSPCDLGCIDFPSIPVPLESPVQSDADVTQVNLTSLQCIPPIDSECYLPGFPPVVRVSPCVDGKALTYDQLGEAASMPCSGQSVLDLVLCVPYRP